MQLIPGPRQVLREAAMLTALPRGLAGLAWLWLSPWTPVHHVEEPGDDSDRPPDLEGAAVRDQPVGDGYGPVLHRMFRIRIHGPRLGPRELVDSLAADMNRAMVPGVARFDRVDGASTAMLVGDELVVRMPGPWDGPVRVSHRDATSFRLATLAGHLEAGQIEFAARWLGDGDGGDDEGGGEDDVLEFAITTWARAGDRLADLFYNHLGVAKEIQFQLWVNACVRAAAVSGGEAPAGVDVRTRVLPWAAAQRRGLVDASPGRGNPRG